MVLRMNAKTYKYPFYFSICFFAVLAIFFLQMFTIHDLILKDTLEERIRYLPFFLLIHIMLTPLQIGLWLKHNVCYVLDDNGITWIHPYKQYFVAWDQITNINKRNGGAIGMVFDVFAGDKKYLILSDTRGINEMLNNIELKTGFQLN
jgi:hypothetical protein